MGILLTQRDGFIIGNIAKLLGFIMNGIFEALSYIGIENIGLCIILFTVIIYTLMLPMTVKQQKTTRLMSVMNPEIQAIQKKYANKKDQASMMKMQEETKLVYEKYGTSPTGGCLGSIIQLPILFALWPVIQNIPAYVSGLKEAYNHFDLVDKIKATEGYQKILETFISENKIIIEADAIKGTNSIVDILYKLQDNTWAGLAEEFPKLADVIEQTQEYIKGFNYFPTSNFGINIAETPSSMFGAAWDTKSILMMIVAVSIPILAGVTQWISAQVAQNATKNRNSNNKNDDNAMMQQMNMMMKIMPLISVFMCFSMPAGLGIYWITSAVVRTVQQIGVNKYLDRKSIDDIVKENMEKAAKKHKNKNEVSSRLLNEMAQKSTRSIDEPQKKTVSNNNVDSYKPNAKPGSLASKANMVSDFNNRNK